ncbi:TPA_asm: fiber [Monosiga MELD virus 1]|nr:TPA_asm: fiber [Monosiga MELD virus 1]
MLQVARVLPLPDAPATSIRKGILGATSTLIFSMSEEMSYIYAYRNFAMAPRYVNLGKEFMKGPPPARKPPTNPYATWDPAELSAETEREASATATNDAIEQFKRMFGPRRRARQLTEAEQKEREAILNGALSREREMDDEPEIGDETRDAIQAAAAAEAVDEATRTADQRAAIELAAELRRAYENEVRAARVSGRLTPSEASKLLDGLTALQTAARQSASARSLESAITNVEKGVADVATATQNVDTNTAPLNAALTSLAATASAVKGDTSELPKLKKAIGAVIAQLNPANAGSFAEQNLTKLDNVDQSVKDARDAIKASADVTKDALNTNDNDSFAGKTLDKLESLARITQQTPQRPQTPPASDPPDSFSTPQGQQVQGAPPDTDTAAHAAPPFGQKATAAQKRTVALGGSSSAAQRVGVNNDVYNTLTNSRVQPVLVEQLLSSEANKKSARALHTIATFSKTSNDHKVPPFTESVLNKFVKAGILEKSGKSFKFTPEYEAQGLTQTGHGLLIQSGGPEDPRSVALGEVEDALLRHGKSHALRVAHRMRRHLGHHFHALKNILQ